MKLVVATRSDGKLREIRRILAEVPGLEVLDLDQAGIGYGPAEEELEPFDTFEENAFSKASYFAARCGLPTVADDSGIEVDALGGAPGVRSKRFASDARPDLTALTAIEVDEANNRHLVERLAGVSQEQRTARYVCVLSYVEDGVAVVPPIRGEAPGLIVDEPAGQGGFGYDPHVYDPGLGKTFAAMTAAEKDARSHRGNAFRQLARILRQRLADRRADA
jgi:XTP/dITP diphosphohydrolase